MSADLSTLSRAALEAHCRHLEQCADLSEALIAAQGRLLDRLRRERTGYLEIIEQAAQDRTESARLAANATPLSTLAALNDAPGWQTTPTAAAVSAHGRAFPYGPHEGTDDDYCAGLWALRDDGGISLVDVCVQAFPEGDEVMVRALGAACVACVEEQIESTIHGATDLAWLRLTADGKPVQS